MAVVAPQMETQPKIAVVILNYNGQHWLEQFLGDVVLKSPEAEMYVADNASTDKSVAYVQENHPSVKIIQNPKNDGYAGGYNLALANICADYYVLLNSDIEVTGNWLPPVIQLMEGDKNIAACQPKIKSFHQKEYFEYAGACGGFIDYLGYPFCRGRIFDTLEKDEKQYEEAREVFWATGACLFVRATHFHEVGGLDADFFAHMEEIDLCWRLQNSRHSIWVQPASTVYHVGGGTLQSGSTFKTYLNFRNNLFMLYKNLERPTPTVFKRLLLDGLAGFKFLSEGKLIHTWAIVRAHFAFYGAINHLKKKRAQTFNAALYPKSILISYYLQGKKKFGDLVE
jgi:GT2 family glycosyltransferase